MTFLGTGTSHGVPMIGCDCAVCRSDDPRDARCRPSIYLEMDDGLRVLVDTTPDLRTQALRFDVRRVDAILFTHAHADHVMGLDEVRRYNILTKSPMPIYARRARRSRRFAARSATSSSRQRQRAAACRTSGSGRSADRSASAARKSCRCRVVHGPWTILGIPVRPVRVPHRLQRHSGIVAGAAATVSTARARRAPAPAASDAFHAGRGGDRRPPDRRPADVFHAHRARSRPRGDVRVTARRDGARARRPACSTFT